MWVNLHIQYAIRPSVSGNKTFNRNIIIKTVADVVGPEHPVDLKNYDLLILVTVIQVRRPLVLLLYPNRACTNN